MLNISQLFFSYTLFFLLHLIWTTWISLNFHYFVVALVVFFSTFCSKYLHLLFIKLLMCLWCWNFMLFMFLYVSYMYFKGWNFVDIKAFKIKVWFFQATFDCLLKTYGFLTPDFWRETRFSRSPFQEYTDLLAKPTTKAITYVEDVAEIPAWQSLRILESMLCFLSRMFCHRILVEFHVISFHFW